MDEPGVVGGGAETIGHGGFQLINLACQFGPPSRLVLVGFDMHAERGKHWHEDHVTTPNPQPDRLAAWAKVLDRCAKQFRSLGVEVLNATPGSALKAYPFVRLADAI